VKDSAARALDERIVAESLIEPGVKGRKFAHRDELFQASGCLDLGPLNWLTGSLVALLWYLHARGWVNWMEVG